jgi:hypothetical protein
MPLKPEIAGGGLNEYQGAALGRQFRCAPLPPVSFDVICMEKHESNYI